MLMTTHVSLIHMQTRQPS